LRRDTAITSCREWSPISINRRALYYC